MPKMTKIKDCQVSTCAYNREKGCHAIAVTIGSEHPMCETFTHARKKGGVPDFTGGVGACRVEHCKFNERLECSAEAIQVGLHSDHPDCITFASR
jgi:hypothetical protein